MRPTIRGKKQATVPAVILLTDDVDNRRKAEKEGLRCFSSMSELRLLKIIAF
jgi:hypothetical protein